jgi:hypothetical protein
VSAIILRQTFMMSQSAPAPEKIRTSVKVAGSRLLSFNAARHRRELLANAIIASSVRMKTRAVLMEENFQSLIRRDAFDVACHFHRRAAQRIALLFDLFPEPATIRNIWEHELALVERERVGTVAATKR